MLARLAVGALLLAWPAVARADQPRPTPLEVAAGVVGCMQDQYAEPLVVQGSALWATVWRWADDWDDPDHALLWIERSAKDQAVMTPNHVWIDDGRGPPLVMWLTPDRDRLPRPLRDRAAACFEQEHRHLLRP